MKVRSSKLSDPSVFSLWERIEGELELLLKNNYEVVAISTTTAAYGGNYYGVIFYKGKS